MGNIPMPDVSLCKAKLLTKFPVLSEGYERMRFGVSGRNSKAIRNIRLGGGIPHMQALSPVNKQRQPTQVI
jgi:hypothetical protein